MQPLCKKHGCPQYRNQTRLEKSIKMPSFCFLDRYAKDTGNALVELVTDSPSNGQDERYSHPPAAGIVA